MIDITIEAPNPSQTPTFPSPPMGVSDPAPMGASDPWAQVIQFQWAQVILPLCTCFDPWCAKVGYQQYPGSLWGHALHHRLDGLLVWTLSDNLFCILFVLKTCEVLVYSSIMYTHTDIRAILLSLYLKKYFKRNMCNFSVVETLPRLNSPKSRQEMQTAGDLSKFVSGLVEEQMQQV